MMPDDSNPIEAQRRLLGQAFFIGLGQEGIDRLNEQVKVIREWAKTSDFDRMVDNIGQMANKTAWFLFANNFRDDLEEIRAIIIGTLLWIAHQNEQVEQAKRVTRPIQIQEN